MPQAVPCRLRTTQQGISRSAPIIPATRADSRHERSSRIWLHPQTETAGKSQRDGSWLGIACRPAHLPVMLDFDFKGTTAPGDRVADRLVVIEQPEGVFKPLERIELPLGNPGAVPSKKAIRGDTPAQDLPGQHINQHVVGHGFTSSRVFPTASLVVAHFGG